MPLNSFDDSRFLFVIDSEKGDWLSDEATALAAVELFPDDTFLDGRAAQTHLEFLLQKPGGERVIAVCWFDNAWKTALSTPLPETAAYVRKFCSSFLSIDGLKVWIGPVDQNTCGVMFIQNGEEPSFCFGKNWFTSEVPSPHANWFGDHPWSDITVIDWRSLPRSPEEALAALDASAWAEVNNPDPADRLHLRESPDRGARSLGKYCNGTPARILETKNGWARVDIFGATGWMMTKYLAFGDAAHAVEAVFPRLAPDDASTHRYVYASPSRTARPLACCHCEYPAAGLAVLAETDDEWYQVWLWENGLIGYVPRSDWRETQN